MNEKKEKEKIKYDQWYNKKEKRNKKIVFKNYIFIAFSVLK